MTIRGSLNSYPSFTKPASSFTRLQTPSFLTCLYQLVNAKAVSSPDDVAAVVAKWIEKAWKEKRAVNLHMHTIRIGADLWREYLIQFDEENQEVNVEIGRVVNTGQVPVTGSEPEGKKYGKAKLSCPFRQNYSIITTVNIFSGPSFGFVPKKDYIDIQFIPWHRGWSHSLTFGALCGIICYVLAALWNGNWLYPAWIFGVIPTLALWAHVLEDQLGFLGSNLFFPFTKERSKGFRMMHANDAIPNFLTVWLSVALMFWNMYLVMPESGAGMPIHINGYSYLLYVIIIPTSIMLTSALIIKMRKKTDIYERPEEDDEEVVAM